MSFIKVILVGHVINKAGKMPGVSEDINMFGQTVYYKVRWNYYTLPQLSLLQSAMIITNCDGTTFISQLF